MSPNLPQKLVRLGYMACHLSCGVMSRVVCVVAVVVLLAVAVAVPVPVPVPVADFHPHPLVASPKCQALHVSPLPRGINRLVFISQVGGFVVGDARVTSTVEAAAATVGTWALALT